MEEIANSAMPKLLVVDDDEGVLRVLRRTLQFQFELSFAKCTHEALKIIDEQGPFAVVITDYAMPGPTGAELIRLARDKHPDTVFLILSGNQDEKASEAISDGMPYRVLTKPCEIAEIRNAVTEAVEHFDMRVAASAAGHLNELNAQG